MPDLTGLYLLFLASVGGSLGLAQQDANNQELQIMTPVSGPSGSVAEGPTDSRESFVDQLDLKMYEAAAGNLSLCGDDQDCLEDVKNIKSWLCAAGVCDGKDKSKNVVDCFGGEASKYFQKAPNQTASLFCSLIKSPSTVTRQAFLSNISGPNVSEGPIVEYGAYLMSLKVSAVSCENYIKDYVGAYGPQWTLKWYRALSGCRILAGESTRDLEEKNFSTWFRVAQGSGSCSDIFISEMRNACNAPGAASSMPSSAQPPVNAQ